MKDGARVGMNVAAHQEKEKNEETKRGKRKTGEERKLATDFKLRAALLRSFKRLHGEKTFCARGVPAITWTLGKANSHFEPTAPGTAPPH